MKLSHILGAIAILLNVSCVHSTVQKSTNTFVATVKQDQLILKFDEKLHSQVEYVQGSDTILLSPLGASEFVELSDGRQIKDFIFVEQRQSEISSELGDGEQLELIGVAKNGVKKVMKIQTFAAVASTAFMSTEYFNTSDQSILVTKWVNHRYNLPYRQNDRPESADF